ncbi:MAG: hypothetical protein FGM24_09320 [Candidatus Kapabacteria bacterium]|nr:hypothetical protein [Candidatus Kapabacteria bacterium]
MNTNAIHARFLCVIVMFAAACTSVWSQGTQTFQTLRLVNPAAPTNGISLAPPSNITAYALTLPATAPTVSGQYLSSNTDGTMSWVTGLTASSVWTTSGNASITNGGTLGSAPTGSFLGTTDARNLSLVTNNVIQLQLSTDGVLSTNKDMSVNSVTVGRGAGSATTTNTAVGTGTLSVNSTGIGNTGLGYNALNASTTGQNNTAMGKDALKANATGWANTAIGIGALTATDASDNNVAIGADALVGHSGGPGSNTAVGTAAGAYYGASGTSLITQAMGSTFVGNETRGLTSSSTQEIVIGAYALGNGNYTATIGDNSNTATHLKGHLHLTYPANSATAPELRLFEPSTSGANYTALKAQAQTANITYTLPSTAPTTGQMLSSTSDGTMSWASGLTASTGWSTTGNQGLSASTNFLGSIDNTDLVIRHTNTEKARVTSQGLRVINQGTMRPSQWVASFQNIGGPVYLELQNAVDSNSGGGMYMGLRGTGNVGDSATIWNWQGGPLAFYTSPVNRQGFVRLFIDNDGDVGIGSHIPTARLHVRGGDLLIDTVGVAGTAGQLQMRNPAGTFQTNIRAGAQTANITYTLPTAAPISSGQVLSSTTDGVMSWATAGGGGGWLTSGNDITEGTDFLGTTAAERLEIRTNNTERMRVTSDGLVYVGASSGPTAQLNVVPASSSRVGVTVRGAASQTGDLLELQNSGGTDLVSVSSSGLVTGTGGATISGAAVNLNDASNFNVNIATGTSTGAVNIGTGASTQTISIGNGAGSKTVALGSTNGTGSTTVSSGSGGINIGQTLDGNINIGSGTGSTGTLRTVNIATATNLSQLQLNIGSTTGNSWTIIRSGNHADGVALNHDNGNPVNIGSGSGGTLSSPQSINIGSNVAGVKTIVIGNSNVNGTSVGIVGNSVGINNASSGSINIANSTANSNTITIASPSSGTATKTISIGSSLGSSVTRIQGGSVGLNLNENVNQPTNINTGTSTGAVTIGGTGNQTISIGNGAANKTVNLGSSTGTSVTTIRAGTGNLSVTTSSSGIVTLGTNNTERMRIASDGLVGIGATSPGAQLHVTTGAAATKGLIVRGAASQTANLLEIQNSSATVLTSVSTDGSISVGGSATVSGAIAPTPGAPATVAADNTAITVDAKSFLRITSDGTPANRTITLSNGLTDGQILVIRVSGGGTAANGIELADAGNLVLTGAATLTDGSTIVLIWDSAASWFEIARSIN